MLAVAARAALTRLAAAVQDRNARISLQAALDNEGGPGHSPMEDAQQTAERNRGPVAWFATGNCQALHAAAAYADGWWDAALRACAYAHRDYARATSGAMTPGDDAYDAEREAQRADLGFTEEERLLGM